MGIFDNEFSGKGIIPTETFGKTTGGGGGGGGGGGFGGGGSIYGSINEVVAAYCQDKITGRQAKNELMNFFNQNDNEAEDIIYTENPCNKEIPNIPIPTPDPDPDTDWQGNEGSSSSTTQTPMKPLTADQQFMLIGALVLFCLFGFIKR